MPRCRSWRPRDPDAPDLGQPGKDRRRWKACHNKVEAGQVRCEECSRALARHPDAAVRRMLAAERGLPRQTLTELAADPDPVVAGLVRARIGAQQGTTPHHQHDRPARRRGVSLGSQDAAA